MVLKILIIRRKNQLLCLYLQAFHLLDESAGFVNSNVFGSTPRSITYAARMTAPLMCEMTGLLICDDLNS